MPEDEVETHRTPGWLGDSILQNGVDQGAARRTVIRDANARRQQADAHKAVQKSQERAEKTHRQSSSS